MEARYCRFTVGGFECVAVSDGALESGPDEPPGPLLFANAPPDDLDVAIRAAGGTTPWTQWTEEITCLLVDTGRQRILLDAGLGALEPEAGRLVEGLAAAGVAPSDVDAVIVSHGHADHIGGLVGPDGSLVFPAARVLLPEAEWRFWTEGEAERALPAEIAAFLVEFAGRTFPVLQPCLEFVEEGGEPFGGVRCLAAPGHTPGHLVVELSSRGERLIYLADLVLHPLHVAHPEWCSVFDSDSVALVRTRRVLLERAAVEACLLHASHLPFPGLGRLNAADAGHTWAAVVGSRG